MEITIATNWRKQILKGGIKLHFKWETRKRRSQDRLKKSEQAKPWSGEEEQLQILRRECILGYNQDRTTDKLLN